MDLVENRLDRFLSTTEFDGLNFKWWVESDFYHYTQESSLESIRSDLKLRNISCNLKNGELERGLRILRDRRSDNCIWKEAAEQVFDEFGGDSLSRYWTFSLCREGESEYMWEHYANKKGKDNPCIIRLRGLTIYEETQKLMESDMACKQGDGHFFLPCLYYPIDKKRIERLCDFLTGDDYFGWLLESDRCGHKRVLAKDICAIFSLMVKDCDKGHKVGEDYEKEQEARLILVSDANGEKDMKSFGLGVAPIVSVETMPLIAKKV